MFQKTRWNDWGPSEPAAGCPEAQVGEVTRGRREEGREA